MDAYTYNQLCTIAMRDYPAAFADGVKHDLAYTIPGPWGPDVTAQKIVYLAMREGWMDENIARMAGAVQATWDIGARLRAADAR